LVGLRFLVGLHSARLHRLLRRPLRHLNFSVKPIKSLVEVVCDWLHE
jgi:hypothetical protein